MARQELCANRLDQTRPLTGPLTGIPPHRRIGANLRGIRVENFIEDGVARKVQAVATDRTIFKHRSDFHLSGLALSGRLSLMPFPGMTKGIFLALQQGFMRMASRNHDRFSQIALVAITWGILVSWGASVSQAADSGSGGHACCATRPVVDCVCCEPTSSEESALRRPGELAIPVAHEAGRVAPCVCRADDPAAPSPNSEPRPAEPRPDQGRVEILPHPALAMTLASRSSISLVVDVCQPARPLYLSTSRLLC